MTDMTCASLVSISPVHVCSVDGDSESHTALDLKLVLHLIVHFSIGGQVKTPNTHTHTHTHTYMLQH